jgi:hypothetical protein
MADLSRSSRRFDEDDRAPRRGERKRTGGRQADRRQGWSELLPAGIAAGVVLLFVPPILLSPFLFFVLLLVAWAISLFAFIRGCLLASRMGNFIAFDYLTALGPIRWFVAVGFFGLYLSGYLLLWSITQITCATVKPKRFLPWFGVHAVCLVAVVLGLVMGAFSDWLWRKKPGPGPLAVQPNSNPSPGPGQGKGKTENKNKPPPPPPDVTGDKELDRCLADISGKDSPAVQKAAKRLASMKPDKNRAVVARKLGESLLTAPVYDRTSLIRALGVWATPEEVPVLLKLLDDKDINTRNEVLRVLGKMRDERTVKPVVKCFCEFSTRYHGEQALKALGPMAETEVLALLDQPDQEMHIPAIYVLKEIGTEKSLPALQTASREFRLKGVAEAAITAIKARARK